MQLIFIFLILIMTPTVIGSYINFADVDCGKSEVANNRTSFKIIGGLDAEEGEFPWMVSIRFLLGKYLPIHFSAGSIINKKWVVTSAHTISDVSIKDIVIVVGDVGSGENRASPNVQVFKAKKILIHPSFVNVKTGYDIALVLLDKEVNWNTFVKPVCVANDARVSFIGETATVTGWGRKEANALKLPSVLQKVDLPIISNSECQQWYRDSVSIMTSVLCAGLEKGGKDACQGDSGGPIMVKMEGRHLLAGITSYGIGCARPKIPGVYTRASSYINWISNTIEKQHETDDLNRLLYRNLMSPIFVY